MPPDLTRELNEENLVLELRAAEEPAITEPVAESQLVEA